MTTAQKIHYLRQFEQILNMLDAGKCEPIGIVTIHETDENIAGFAPLHTKGAAPNQVYGMMLVEIGKNMITTEPVEQFHQKQ